LRIDGLSMSGRTGVDHEESGCSGLFLFAASFGPAWPIRRTLSVLFAIVLTVVLAAPALRASEGEGQEAAEPERRVGEHLG
jgi:hypothetical protein